MRRACVVLAAVAVLATFLPLGPSAGTGATPVVRPTGAAAFVTDIAPVPDGAAVRPLPGATPVVITVVLNPRGGDALAAYDAAVVDPSSPNYHRFLTEQQFETSYRPAPLASDAVTRYFAGAGAEVVGRTPDGFGITVRIPAAVLPTVLGVVPVAYATPIGSGFTVLGVPHLPVSIAPYVAGLDGLSGSNHGHATLRADRVTSGVAPRVAGPRFVHDNQSGESWYFGTDYAQAYRVSELFPGASTLANATYPTGEAVATILMSGYNDSAATDLAPFDPAAVTQYFNDSFPAAWPKPVVVGQPVTVAGVTPPAPGPSGALNDTTLDQSENSLDLEMAGSAAPGATLVNFYLAASLSVASSSTTASLADGFAQCLSQALSYDYGSARLAAVTNSYGLPDLNDTLWNQELAHAAALGVTVLAASGDQADAPQGQTGRGQGQWPGWPATAAFATSGVVSVGGTTVTMGGTPVGSYGGSTFPTGYDSNLTGITSAVAWYETLSAHLSGTEGGISTVYPEPAWQFVSAAQPEIAAAAGTQGAAQLGRASPDVAMAANNTIAYVAASSSTIFFNILEGTSVASPLLAGELASIAAVAGHPFGFVAPELYRIGSYYAAFPTPTSPFLDITTGSNWVFSARPGWDAVTGWGQVDALNFLAADANRTVSGYQYTGPTPGIPPHENPGGVMSPVVVEYLGGALIAVGVAIVIVVAGRPRPRPPAGYPGTSYAGPGYGIYSPPPPGDAQTPAPYGVPASASGYPPPPPPGIPSWFACPYCGAPRPAEPTRCPYCGRL